MTTQLGICFVFFIGITRREKQPLLFFLTDTDKNNKEFNVRRMLSVLQEKNKQQQQAYYIQLLVFAGLRVVRNSSEVNQDNQSHVLVFKLYFNKLTIGDK